MRYIAKYKIEITIDDDDYKKTKKTKKWMSSCNPIEISGSLDKIRKEVDVKITELSEELNKWYYG